MDVHGTKLARTPFTIATGVEGCAAYQRSGAYSQLIPGVAATASLRLLKHKTIQYYSASIWAA